MHMIYTTPEIYREQLIERTYGAVTPWRLGQRTSSVFQFFWGNVGKRPWSFSYR